jgi:hypothetical protein
VPEPEETIKVGDRLQFESSDSLKHKVKRAVILSDAVHSDHYPILVSRITFSGYWNLLYSGEITEH